MNAEEYRVQLARLGLTHAGAAKVLGVDARTSRRWALGEREVPTPVARLLWACEKFPKLLRMLQEAE